MNKIDNAKKEQALQAINVIIEATNHDVFIKAREALVSLPEERMCANCKHSKIINKKVLCGLVDKTPPEEVQNNGCKKWVSDGCPISL